MLRDYQQKQYDFLMSRRGIRGLESPTGTGKSYVIREIVKNLPNDTKIIITTATNELVFQLFETLKDLGAQIKIGHSHLIPTCSGKKVQTNYSLDPINICNNCHKTDHNCIKEVLKFSNSRIIITNHSYFLYNELKCDYLIVDEAQTFNDFYKDYNSEVFDGELGKSFIKFIKSDVPINRIVRNAMEKNEPLSISVLRHMAKEISKGCEESESQILNKLKNVYMDSYFEIHNYTEIGDDYVRFIRFYNKFPTFAKDTILMSATLDALTIDLFNVLKKNIYVQKLPGDRYKNSKYSLIEKDFRDAKSDIRHILKSNNVESGIILSTTLSDVEWALENFNDWYNVYTDVSEFKKGQTPKLLIGSKRLFQGVSIDGIECVIMNKIPFNNYDNEEIAREKYFSKVLNKNYFTNYTIPLVNNMVNQGSGRIWRKNDIENGIYDDGIFIITDSRLPKFAFVKTNIQRTRKGIKGI